MPVSQAVCGCMSRSHLLLAASYGLAITLAYLSLPLFSEYPVLVQVLLADIVATIVAFSFSLAFGNSSFYDPFWSLIPIVIGVYFIGVSVEADSWRQILAMSVVGVWGLRLTANFLYTWEGLEHQDWRYIELQSQSGLLWQPVNFLGIHLIPTVIVFLGCVPLYYALSVGSRELNAFDGLAFFVGALSIWLEYQADVELHRFRDRRQSREEVLSTGLWSCCRHPNYLGELGLWLSLLLFGYAATGNAGGWMTVGFFSMVALFVSISIPMIERKMTRDKPGYVNYKSSTYTLVPFSLLRSHK